MRVGLLGRHIGYSHSPEIHQKVYSDRGLPLTYELFDVKREDLQEFIDNLSKEEIVGFNVTIPFKETIMGYIHELNSTALECGAVNTVVIKNGWRIGYNTDVFGFQKSLDDLRINVEGKDVLILGSGGAARAVYMALKEAGSHIDMAFRSIERRTYFKEARRIFPLEEASDISKYALVVNCTKLGNVNDDRSPIEIHGYSPNTVLYDLNYEPTHSAFLRKGASLGLQVINGESMLYNQALKAIELWTDALKLF